MLYCADAIVGRIGKAGGWNKWDSGVKQRRGGTARHKRDFRHETNNLRVRGNLKQASNHRSEPNVNPPLRLSFRTTRQFAGAHPLAHEC